MKKLIPVLVMSLFSACSDSGLYTNADKTPQANITEMTDGGSTTITKNAFLFGSDYPSRIIIPDIDGMRSTAFVVSTAYPAGVVPLDLDSSPIQVSSKFKGVVQPGSSGGATRGLVIQSAMRGFMLTSSHIIDFNPTTGDVRSLTAIPKSITLPQPAPLSGPLDYDNNGSIDTTITTVPISFPGDIIITGNSLWITTANYLRYATPAVTAPGIVLRYTITDTGITGPSYTVTSGFNPTGLAVSGNSILVTNSGVINIVNGEAQPQTASAIDFVDTITGAITATAAADLSALTFNTPMIDADGQYAYYGSTAFSEAYQLDIAQKKFTRNLLNPILFNPTGTADFITGIASSHDGSRGYVGSFDRSSIYIMDMTALPIAPLSTSYVIGFSKGVTPDNPSGENTGVSDLAVRPGTSDLYVLTGNPGTLVTITSKPPPAAKPNTKYITISPSFIPLEVGTSGGVSVTVTHKDGSQKMGVTSGVTWTSDNSAIATVSATGAVTAVAEGITTIHATFDGVTTIATVVVHKGVIAAAPAVNGKLIVVNCYIDQVVSYSVGAGGGYNETKLPSVIMGAPQGAGVSMGSTDTFSLGAKGGIIVAFNNCWIKDGPGTDFTVFENAFYAGGNPKLPFSEPGIVGVSQDGVTFTDFPCDLTQAPFYPGCAGTHPVYSNPKNNISPLDSTVSGGDLFDLATIGIKEARFVRIIDQGLTTLPGANGTNGFDLDAIAVINGTSPTP